MAHDRLYYWDKIGRYGTRYLLGEVQTGYNIGITIDGSKDTAKMEVYSYSMSEPIKPFTVVWHENTNTYFIVSKDKVERHPNEVGYWYRHSLQLDGAVELLNARDLTDCGFYQNMYTINEMARRLIKLSTFEFSDNTPIVSVGGLRLTDTVEYVKSFENYTLLSALREMFDAYNCSIKLRFNQDTAVEHALISANLLVVSKVGTGTPVGALEEYMNDTRGISTSNKNSYGNAVISNADNVISTKTKIYPNIGYARLSSEGFYIKPQDGNVCFRLPSKVNSVEYVEAINGSGTKIAIGYNIAGAQTSDYRELEFDPSDINSYRSAIEWARGLIENPNEFPPEIGDYIDNTYGSGFWDTLMTDEYAQGIEEEVTFRFYDVKGYDPLSNIFISDKPIHKFFSAGNTNGDTKPWVLGSKNIRDGVEEKESVMYWERGSDLIRGFNFLSWHQEAGKVNVVRSLDTVGRTILSFTFQYNGSATATFKMAIGNVARNHSSDGNMDILPLEIDVKKAMFRCKYVPMTDLKIKYDNTNVGHDGKLYNQNGKYTDGVALSKLLLSYKDEIESDTITRYAEGFVFGELPQVGEVYTKDGENYVIGSASYDFVPNDDGGYKIYGEYTLSKNVATKSALTSPNTNIRDYGIPQQYNVRRKQLFRDFYELTFSPDESAIERGYLYFDKAVNVTSIPSQNESHTAFIKCTYEEPCGGGGKDINGNTVPKSSEYYFQVDSTVYYMKKSFYEVIDFKDNNIIGYDSQNITCGFDIRRIFEMVASLTDKIDTINTPVSYVDDKGKVKDIMLSMVSSNSLKTVWDIYKQIKEAQYGVTYRGSLYNRCVFIPQEVFDTSFDYCDYFIDIADYKKDPIEVPVFEYSCQIDDTEDVAIGENILEQHEDDYLYFYEAVVVPHGVANSQNWRNYATNQKVTQYQQYLQLDTGNANDRKAVTMSFGSSWSRLLIDIWHSVNIDTTNLNEGSSSHLYAHNWLESYEDDIDLMIIRHTVPKNYTLSGSTVSNETKELMMIIRNAKNCPYSQPTPSQPQTLRLCINYYKLN